MVGIRVQMAINGLSLNIHQIRGPLVFGGGSAPGCVSDSGEADRGPGASSIWAGLDVGQVLIEKPELYTYVYIYMYIIRMYAVSYVSRLSFEPLNQKSNPKPHTEPPSHLARGNSGTLDLKLQALTKRPSTLSGLETHPKTSKVPL